MSLHVFSETSTVYHSIFCRHEGQAARDKVVWRGAPTLNQGLSVRRGLGVNCCTARVSPASHVNNCKDDEEGNERCADGDDILLHKRNGSAPFEENLQVGTWIKCCEVGQISAAVEALEFLVRRKARVDHSVFYSLLKKCTLHKDLVIGRRVHALVVEVGYGSNPFLANHIICMYAAHGRLRESMQVFGAVRSPDRYMWASIMLAHARHGSPKKAILLYKQMREAGLKANNHIFVAALKACAAAEDLSSGRQVHLDILREAHRVNMFVGNSLVDMYAKCGSLDDARKVFDSLPARDVVTWTSLIGGYVQHGRGQDALVLYASMQRECIGPANTVTFVCLLQACARIGALHDGTLLHSQIRERGLEGDVVVGTCLVDMYAKCGSLQDARRVFDSLPTKNVVTWNAMIAGYSQQGHGKEALDLYGRMEQLGIVPADAATFVCLLQACASSEDLIQGQKLHTQIQEKGFLIDVNVCNCLVNMYAKCGSLDNARSLFDNLQRKDVVTWNAMIAGYAQHGLGHTALALHEEMQLGGIIPEDAVTFVCLLQACTAVGAWRQGQDLHKQIKARGLEGDLFVGNCLVDMYAKCGSFGDARRVFEGMLARDSVTWNSMIGGFAQHGLGGEALDCYELMREEGICVANSVTFLCLLQACGSVARLNKGKEIHLRISDLGLLASDPFLASTLIDMYGKCGSMADAQQVFDVLTKRDVVTWNALIAGYAHHGESEPVFLLFQRMRQEGVQPNSLVFLSLLTVCSHVGLVDKGLQYFEALQKDYCISPTLEHYNCMVDLLGRAGHVAKALALVNSMPFEPGGVMWRSLLGACFKWSNLEVGKHAFLRAVKLDRYDAAVYVLMSNIYAEACLLEEARQIQKCRVMARAWKRAGQTRWTSADGIVHTFLAGDEEHPDRNQIYSELEGFLRRLKREW